jgi:uncharacterized coiled-coil protein SlyX
MSIPVDALTAAGSAIFGSLTVYASSKFQARKNAQTENRKVDLSEFELFKKSYQETITDFKERYTEQEEKIEKMEHLLRLALQHIQDLRRDMREHDVNPSHQTPEELEPLLWTLGGGPSAQGN